MKPSRLVPPPIPRGPWQWFYGMGHRLRRQWYSRRAQRLPKPVISIGNLHWGGGGKTPMVAAVAAWLRDAGWRVAILSRGYKSRGEGVRVVSRGEGPLLGPMIAGDEPALLAGQLPGVAVLVCPDRHHAGQQALYRLDAEPDVFLLDDGFSHLRLHRDLDILVFPVADPFGGGRLPPSGRLREPLASASRADAVVMSGADVGDDAGAELAVALRPFGFHGPGFAAPVRPETAVRVPEGTPVDLAGRRVLLASAIARPRNFTESALSLGAEVAGEIRFPDHHHYPDSSLDKIRLALVDRDAELVLVTSKDRVKLQGRTDLPLVELPIRAEPEAGFFEWLEAQLAEERHPEDRPTTEEIPK